MTAVEDWYDYLRQRNRSLATITSYDSIMRHFVPDPLAATVEDIDEWWRRQNGLSASSRTRALSCLRSFYRWAIRFDRIDRDPTRRLDPPKKGHRLPQPVSRADLARLLEAGKAEPDMRRAVCLGAYAGLRVGEAAALDWRDVDRESRRLYVRGGKGDKDRAIGLSVVLLDELLPDTGANVITGAEPMSAGALQRKVNRFIARAGVDATYHKLRARYATMGLAHTGNLLAVSRALGHSSPSTTAIYAATADSDLDLIAEAVTR